jgi:hypothetical protein
MNDAIELRYPNWQDPLHKVILEFDREKLAPKALEVEGLIRERLRELQQSNNGFNERNAICDGLFILRMIKRDRLGHADW